LTVAARWTSRDTPLNYSTVGGITGLALFKQWWYLSFGKNSTYLFLIPWV
jgi:hypothetical protein